MEFLSQYWMYLIIPLVSALIGWVTNWLAIKMTFSPVDYIGLGPWIGWQGIIPARASHMAGKSVDLMLGKLIDMGERFDQVDPDEVARLSQEELSQFSEMILHRIMKAQAPLLWTSMPSNLQKKIADGVAADMPAMIAHTMEDLRSDINSYFDVRSMVIETLTKDKALLNEIFLRCGKEEFKFIIKSGFFFGFLFGLIQMVIWLFYQPWWLLPLAGLIVGYATNFLALRLIFSPVKPIYFLGLKFQGLFIKRQKEVSLEYAIIVSKDILNVKNIFNSIIYGPRKNQLMEILSNRTREVIDQAHSRYKPISEVFTTKRQMDIASNIANHHMLDHFPIVMQKISGYLESALDLKNIFFLRMSTLEPREFQSFLRPVFQEDEWKLIAVGALLGALAGLAQYLVFF